MSHRLRLALTCLSLASACSHPMQQALDRGDYLGACRAYKADDKAFRIDRSVTKRMDLWLRDQLDLRLRVDLVPAASLREEVAPGQQIELEEPVRLYRVTVTAAHLPDGSRVTVDPPLVLEREDATFLKPALATDPRPLTAERLASYLKPPPELKLEHIPAEYLPREYVKEEFVEDGRPGRYVYEETVDPAKLALGLVTGGITWLLGGGPNSKERVWVPTEDKKVVAAHEKVQAKKRVAHEKEEAKKKEAFEAAQKAKAEQDRARIEAITARNRETVAAHERLLAARKAFVERWLQAFTPSCRVGDKGDLTLAQGEACTYLTWGDYQPKHFIMDRWGVKTTVWASLSDASDPCVWGLEDFVVLQGVGAFWENAVHPHFAAGERRLKLDVEPP